MRKIRQMGKLLKGRHDVPHTEGIKYTGSKLRLLPVILDTVRQLDVRDVLDAFSGTTRVSQAFAQEGYDVTANDISEWSEVFGNCYLISGRPDAYYREIIDMLNALPGYDGWFTEHYGSDDPAGKKPFRIHNTRKLDAIRDSLFIEERPVEEAVAGNDQLRHPFRFTRRVSLFRAFYGILPFDAAARLAFMDKQLMRWLSGMKHKILRKDAK